MGLSREACQGTAPPVVSCYNASDRVYKGCFDGNVTLTAGERVGGMGSAGVVVASRRPHWRWVALSPEFPHLQHVLETVGLSSRLRLERQEKHSSTPDVVWGYGCFCPRVFFGHTSP